MPKIPECDRCLFCAHTYYLVCAVHPDGVDEYCPDFTEDPEWESEVTTIQEELRELTDRRLLGTRLPTLAEIREIVEFLPILYADGFTPIRQSNPQFEYEPVVISFYMLCSGEHWIDYNYNPPEARRLFDNDDLIRNASLSQIKTMLTYCVRGERFCDGFWAGMIEGGYIRQLLERLMEIASTMTDSPTAY